MNKELENKISATFPFMKKGKSLVEQHKAGFVDDLYSAFNLDCGDGWYNLIYELCTDIQKLLDESKMEVCIKVEQVKEKFGGLRFYYSLSFNEDEVSEVGKNKQKDERKELLEKVSKLVDSYEDKSYKICELCGNIGKLREDLEWMETLCDKCYAKVISKQI